MKTITVTIDATGEVRIDATGFKGGACERLTADLEKALGTSGPHNKKPEFFLPADQQQKAGQG